MALATRCPACGTTFRVVSDQLKLQRGLVKCGNCSEVFDGIEHMRYTASVVTPSSTTAPATAPASVSAPPTISAPESFRPMTESVVPDTRSQDVSHDVEDEPIQTVTVEKTDARRRFFRRRAMTEAEIPAQNSSPNPSDEEAKDGTTPVTQVELENYDLPSFMLPNQKNSLASRLLWSFFVLTACLLLLAQSSYWYRHEIVAYAEPRFPGVSALITQTCQTIPLQADCSIQLPRHIERLKVSAAEVIETSTPGLYSLRLSLRNESSLPQAYPALDMTLSDARNTIVTRRVLLPQEYVPSQQGAQSTGREPRVSEGLTAQAEQSFMLPIRIESESNGSAPIRIAGYLVEIFYP
jgi:predicted Zn finger-like uncharacterized protein